MMNWYKQEINAAPASVNPHFVLQLINEVDHLISQHSHEPGQGLSTHPVQMNPSQISGYQQQLQQLHAGSVTLSNERDHLRNHLSQLKQFWNAQQQASVREISRLKRMLHSREQALLAREGECEKSHIDVTELGLHLARAHNIRAGNSEYIISQFLAKGVGPDTVRRMVSRLEFVRELSTQMAPRRSHRIKRLVEKRVQEESEMDSDEGAAVEEKEDLWSPESTS